MGAGGRIGQRFVKDSSIGILMERIETYRRRIVCWDDINFQSERRWYEIDYGKWNIGGTREGIIVPRHPPHSPPFFTFFLKAPIFYYDNYIINGYGDKR